MISSFLSDGELQPSDKGYGVRDLPRGNALTELSFWAQFFVMP
jgi:hypothetical protein